MDEQALQWRVHSVLNHVPVPKMLFNDGTQLSNCTFDQHSKE